MFERIREDIDAIKARDPAAGSSLEVLLCYPGLHAVIWYRMARWFWTRRLRLVGRVLAQIGRMLTGVEIHPGATLGRRVFIDHANSVVIGETAEIGDDVTLYQGVTLGGTSLQRGKRHPTLENNVIVGAGAHVLGPVTIGEGARIGANAVVLQDVPAATTMVGIPARAVARSKAEDDTFCAYGVPRTDLPDPVARIVDGLSKELAAVTERLAALEGDGPARPAPNNGAGGRTKPAARAGTASRPTKKRAGGAAKATEQQEV